MKKRIFTNVIKTPDGTILESKNRHDFISHIDTNGEYYSNDGGLDYFHRSVNKIPYEDLSVYDEDNHENRIKYLKWGSYYDKEGKRLESPIYREIMNMETSHLEALLSGIWMISEQYLEIFKEELKRRKNE